MLFTNQSICGCLLHVVIVHTCTCSLVPGGSPAYVHVHVHVKRDSRGGGGGYMYMYYHMMLPPQHGTCVYAKERSGIYPMSTVM